MIVARPRLYSHRESGLYNVRRRTPQRRTDNLHEGPSEDVWPSPGIDDINLEIKKGAIGILGPNGAGKSTLVKCLLGLITTTSGEGTVLGHDIRTQGEIIRSKIGYMPEYNALDPNLFAIDQVRYSGELLE